MAKFFFGIQSAITDEYRDIGRKRSFLEVSEYRKVTGVIPMQVEEESFPLQRLNNKRVIEYIIMRIKKSVFIDNILIALSSKSHSRAKSMLKDICSRYSIGCYEGHQDMFLRIVEALEKVEADVVVRICDFFPLVDPEFVDFMIKEHIMKNADYTFYHGVPVGIGVDVLSKEALKKVYKRGFRRDFRAFIRENSSFKKVVVETPARWREVGRYIKDFRADRVFGTEILKEVYARFKDPTPELIIALLKEKRKREKRAFFEVVVEFAKGRWLRRRKKVIPKKRINAVVVVGYWSGRYHGHQAFIEGICCKLKEEMRNLWLLYVCSKEEVRINESEFNTLKEKGIHTETLVFDRDILLDLVVRFAMFLKEKDISFVNINTAPPNVYIPCISSSWLYGVPYITWHLNGFEEHPKHTPYLNLVRRLLLKLTDCTTVNSLGMKDLVGSYCGFSKRMSVLHAGVELQNLNKPKDFERLKEKFKLSPTDKIVGYVGNIYKPKGLPCLIEAVPKVLRKVPKAKFMIVGGGNTGMLEKLAGDHGVVDNLVFAGVQPRNRVSSFIECFDVAVLPSLWEAFGLFACEAMAMEKPVVATEVGGIPEIVKNGVSGLLVPPEDSDALADAIVKLLENKDLARKMGEKGREIVESHFTLKKWIDRYSRCVFDMVEKGRTQPIYN